MRSSTTGPADAPSLFSAGAVSLPEGAAATPTIGSVLYLATEQPDWQRQLRWVDGLFDSISTFWRGADPLPVRVIASDAAVTRISQSVMPVPGIELAFLAEEELTGSAVADQTMPQPQRRSLVNLLSVALLDTDFLLTLTPNVFFIDSFDAPALLPNGRALTSWQSTQYHPATWMEAGRILGITELPSSGLAAGPAILYRAGVRVVLDRIAERSGEQAAKALSRAVTEGNSGWSDTSLYSLVNTDDLAKWHQMTYIDAANRRARLYSVLPRSLTGLFDTWAEDTPSRGREFGRFFYWDPERFADPEELLSQLYWILPQ